MKIEPRDKWLIPLSFFAIYILWGANYLANFYAIQDIPVFLMCSGRFFIAGALLYLIVKAFGVPNPTRIQWRNAIFSGFLFLVLGTAAIIWSLQFVYTGIASLIVGLEPLVIVLLLWKMRGQKPRKRSWIGISIGFVGMGLLVMQDQFLTDDMTLVGIGVILFCIIAWGYATLYVGDKDLPESKLLTSAIQMLSGGVILFFISLVAGEWQAFEIQNVGNRAWGGLTFAIICGSLISFSAFNYLLVKVSPEKVATSTYINPIVAMLVGWYFNNEELSSQSLVAALLMLFGVFFIVSKKTKQEV